MNNRQCSIPDCSGRLYCRGWCQRHYYSWNRYGEPLAAERQRAERQPANTGTCAVDDCEKPAHSRGWCSMHCERWRLRGDLNARPKPQRPPCAVEECGEVGNNRGFCRPHYNRWKRYGDPLAIGDGRAKQSRGLKAYWAAQTPEARHAKAAHARKSLTPDVIERRSKAVRAAERSSEWRKRNGELARVSLARPDVKARQKASLSKTLLAHWATATPEQRQKHLTKWLAAGQHASQIANPTSIETRVYDVLSKLAIEFVPQHRIGTFIVDAYLPLTRTVLECDGTYWHGLAGAVERDARRDAWLGASGYRVVRLTEPAIRANALDAVSRGLGLGLHGLANSETTD